MTKTSKVTRAQAFVEGLDVAKMIMEFQAEFAEVYPDHILHSDPFVAVGPTHSFIGYCIQKGYLEVPTDQ